MAIIRANQVSPSTKTNPFKSILFFQNPTKPRKSKTLQLANLNQANQVGKEVKVARIPKRTKRIKMIRISNQRRRRRQLRSSSNKKISQNPKGRPVAAWARPCTIQRKWHAQFSEIFSSTKWANFCTIACTSQIPWFRYSTYAWHAAGITFMLKPYS